MDKKLKYNWIDKNHLELTLSGDYISYHDDQEKNDFFSNIHMENLKKLTFNTKNLDKWDSSLLVIFYDILSFTQNKDIKVDLKTLPSGLQSLIGLAFSVDRKPTKQIDRKESFLARWGQKTIDAYSSFKKGTAFIFEALHSIGRFFRGKAIMRKVDFLYALEDCSYRAFPIVALISFMVGLIFGFVGAVQLKVFGAQIYVASLVAIAMVRVMGAVMTGIIMAGRTGSSYAATIGTMQVNEEIDALNTMGIPSVDFLLLPRVMALFLMMPILTVFSDILGMMGGAFVGIFMLDLSPQEYWETSLKALNVRHFLVGIFHGLMFGIVISLCGCYYGINCGRDADSVGKATTYAVVSSIVWIIIVTAIITIICNWLGI